MAITSNNSDNATEKKSVFYRPEWTCGRYNAEKKVAIYYNLIEGLSYLFEDDSAEIIGEVLKTSRNGLVDGVKIARQTNTAIESIDNFFNDLTQANLLTTASPESEGISRYRKAVSEFRRSQSNNIKKTEDKLPMAVSSAEMDYMEKAGGVAGVMFELTYNCSEQCVHCYNIGATRNDNEISHRGDLDELNLDDYKRIIDQLYDEGLVKACLSGGDPFSKPIAWDIIDYLYQKGIAIDIFTNGQLLETQVERLAGYYPRVVGVSIYSGEAAVHDAITRRAGSWERSMSVVSQLSAFAVPLEIKCCVMRPNVKSYRMVADIAKKYGAVAQFEISISDSIEGDKCASRYLRLTPELLEIVLRDDNIPLYVGEEAPNYGGQEKILSNNACGAGVNTFCITPDGLLIPCCAFHMSFGNLKTQSLSEILHDSEKLKWWQSLSLHDYEECGKLDYCAYCNLCPGNNYSEHGTPLKAGENNCYMAKVRYQLAQRMMNGYDPLHGQSIQACLDHVTIHQQILRRLYE